MSRCNVAAARVGFLFGDAAYVVSTQSPIGAERVGYHVTDEAARGETFLNDAGAGVAIRGGEYNRGSVGYRVSHLRFSVLVLNRLNLDKISMSYLSPFRRRKITYSVGLLKIV